ncbi:MAG: DUF4400 domain-containing protein [Methylicorpusculum sp.]|uniref:DUF4400 domain-containing protein n=1 Tax=Methylicorpusculum sp. TaxID=2713644 RepID=UPI0027242991|nr:DUF4400 domain-containing protein [Methylicorpusculum sp.]MDO8941083.1 DUF4400 domain-containing protein [Methylicorpusculum sp.]MDP2202318.1 DUF4400 domain-containing protein [Methylicorpusculum sp.]
MTKHCLIWLLVLLFTPLIVPELVSPKTLSTIVSADYSAGVRLFGDKALIDKPLLSLYKNRFAPANAWVDEFLERHDDSDRFRHSGDHIGEAIADIPGDWAAAVKLQIYSLALRSVLLVTLCKWLWLPCAMALIAGIVERRLKYETFTPPSPPIYNTSLHCLLAMSGALLLWLLCPIPVPVKVLPGFCMSFGFLLSLAFANYP